MKSPHRSEDKYYESRITGQHCPTISIQYCNYQHVLKAIIVKTLSTKYTMLVIIKKLNNSTLLDAIISNSIPSNPINLHRNIKRNYYHHLPQSYIISVALKVTIDFNTILSSQVSLRLQLPLIILSTK